jgi:BRCT domain type II-containing protein
MAVLLTGELRPINTREVRNLPCSDMLKAVVRRAIGEPGQHYLTARSMAAGLRPVTLHPGRVRTLKGRKIVFTGPMTMGRKQAKELARCAGATVAFNMGPQVNIVVVGNLAQNWFAVGGGVKLLDVVALRERGHRITLIDEGQFERLVAPWR